MMTVNKIRVRNLAEAGLSHAVVLEKILSNQPKMLSAILIGNNIVNISASSLMTVLVTDVLGNKYVGIGTGVLTLLVLIFVRSHRRLPRRSIPRPCHSSSRNRSI